MSRGGFISTTLAPVPRRRESHFGLLDGAILLSLLLGMAAVVLICIA